MLPFQKVTVISRLSFSSSTPPFQPLSDPPPSPTPSMFSLSLRIFTTLPLPVSSHAVRRSGLAVRPVSRRTSDSVSALVFKFVVCGHCLQNLGAVQNGSREMYSPIGRLIKKMKNTIAFDFIHSFLRKCVKVAVASLGSPSLTVLMVSADAKQH